MNKVVATISIFCIFLIIVFFLFPLDDHEEKQSHHDKPINKEKKHLSYNQPAVPEKKFWPLLIKYGGGGYYLYYLLL